MTNVFKTTKGVAIALAFTIGLAAPAAAQDVSEEAMTAARSAIGALGATDQFDNILPNAAEALKSSLIQANPNFQEVISATVDEMAIEIAGRRGDLEREAAMIYATSFTTEELNAITAFYSSDAGKKLLENGPVVTRELLKAADIWAAGIARDLSSESGKKLSILLEGEGDSN